MRHTTRLRTLLAAPEILLLPCCHDALSARIAVQTGFQAVMAGGYGASAQLLGQPDVGLLTMTEMADHIARMADNLPVPLFVDADTGHGGILNTIRTVKAFERAGAAGLFIEDQVAPKRCGHMQGKEIVSRQEILAKLAAALDARQDPDFVVMARTDALATHGMDEALARARLLCAAGADMIFIEAPRTRDELVAVARATPAFAFGAYLEGGRIPEMPASDYQAMGFQAVAYATSALYAAAYAVKETFEEILHTGGTAGMRERMYDFESFNRLVGLGELRDRESAYAKRGRKAAGEREDG